MAMNPWLLRVGLAAAANAITLLIAASFLDRFGINAVPFIVAVAIFTAVVILLKPFVESLAGKYARQATWVAGLVTTYVALLVADILSNGIEIEGGGTWIMATIIVWLGTLAYDLVDDKLIAAISGHAAAGPGTRPGRTA
jgi:putative membrane protein